MKSVVQTRKGHDGGPAEFPQEPLNNVYASVKVILLYINFNTVI